MSQVALKQTRDSLLNSPDDLLVRDNTCNGKTTPYDHQQYNGQLPHYCRASHTNSVTHVIQSVTHSADLSPADARSVYVDEAAAPQHRDFLRPLGL